MRDWSLAAWFHLVSAIMWIPVTVIIFYAGLQNAVWLVFLLSIYANLKTDWGDFHAAVAASQEAKK